jgi:hypothetical protein
MRASISSLTLRTVAGCSPLAHAAFARALMYASLPGPANFATSVGCFPSTAGRL